MMKDQFACSACGPGMRRSLDRQEYLVRQEKYPFTCSCGTKYDRPQDDPAHWIWADCKNDPYQDSEGYLLEDYVPVGYTFHLNSYVLKSNYQGSHYPGKRKPMSTPEPEELKPFGPLLSAEPSEEAGDIFGQMPIHRPLPVRQSASERRKVLEELELILPEWDRVTRAAHQTISRVLVETDPELDLTQLEEFYVLEFDWHYGHERVELEARADAKLFLEAMQKKYPGFKVENPILSVGRRKILERMELEA